jgi:hypothetical protein
MMQGDIFPPQKSKAALFHLPNAVIIFEGVQLLTQTPTQSTVIKENPIRSEQWRPLS